jgi:hypothetical protein
LTWLALWPWLNDALAAFSLLSTINAFNLIDGGDGLAGGVGIAAAVAVTTIALLHGETAAALCGLAITGALAGFLLYNLHPASIFMGDCGALPLGLLLGFVSLHVGGIAAGNSRLSRYVVPILIMLVPLLDTAIVCVSRMATGRPVWRRGLDHSHHRLLLLGLSDKCAVVVCWSAASVTGLCAIALTVMPHGYLLALPFIVLAFALLALFMIDLTFDDANPPGAALRLSAAGGAVHFDVQLQAAAGRGRTRLGANSCGLLWRVSDSSRFCHRQQLDGCAARQLALSYWGYLRRFLGRRRLPWHLALR